MTIYLVKFFKFAEISRRQIKLSQFLDIPILEITKLILCQIVIFEKPPNKIAVKYSSFTVQYIHMIYGIQYMDPSLLMTPLCPSKRVL